MADRFRDNVLEEYQAQYDVLITDDPTERRSLARRVRFLPRPTPRVPTPRRRAALGDGIRYRARNGTGRVLAVGLFRAADTAAGRRSWNIYHGARLRGHARQLRRTSARHHRFFAGTNVPELSLRRRQGLHVPRLTRDVPGHFVDGRRHSVSTFCGRPNGLLRRSSWHAVPIPAWPRCRYIPQIRSRLTDLLQCFTKEPTQQVESH